MNKYFSIFLFIIASSVQLLAQSRPEEKIITYKCGNKPLPIVLKELSKLANANIVFSPSKFNSRKNVTISATNEKLSDVLKVILDPYNLTIDIVEDVIVVVNKKNKEIYNDFIISGYTIDKSSNELLPYSSIYTLDNESAVYSNEKGFYSLKLRRGNNTIIFSYIGFKTDTLSFYLKKDSTINRNLLPLELQLDEVIIREDLSKTSLKYGEDYFSESRIAKSGSLLGETDVIRSVMSSAGVSSGSDGFGGISVRGGNNDQNLILYDGVPVQNTGHTFGLVSLFNSSVIKDARLIKGAFPARYGGRLSSVLDIKTRDGNKQKFGGEAGLSLIAGHVTLEGPIQKGSSSFLFSYRRTYADPFIKLISDYANQIKEAKGNTSYSFNDLNAKVSFDLGKKNQLSFSAYSGGDNYSNNSKKLNKNNAVDFISQSNTSQNWGNRLYSIHLNSQIKNNQYSKLIIFKSNWNSSAFLFSRNAKDTFNTVNDTDIFNADFKQSDFGVTGIKWDYDYQINPKYLLRLGAGYNLNNSFINFKNLSSINYALPFLDSLPVDTIEKRSNPFDYNSSEAFVYSEFEILSGRNSVFNLGLHTSLFTANTANWLSFQPRLSYTINGTFSWFNVSAAHMRQYQHALSENGLGFPSDLWVTSTKIIKPADAYNFSSTLGFLFGKYTSLSFGGYYKIMKNIASLGEGQTLAIASNSEWQKSIPSGEGRAYGGELTFLTTSKYIDLDANLTLGKSDRTFADLNNNKTFLYRFDRPVITNLNIGLKLGKITTLNLFGTYQSGSRVSFPSGGIFEIKTSSGSFIYPIFEEKNNYSFENYIRMDVTLSITPKSKLGDHKILVGVYNVMNKKNPIYLKLDRNTFDLNTYEINEVSIFPIVPTLSYSLKF